LDELFRLRLLYIYRHRNYPIVGENIGINAWVYIDYTAYLLILGYQFS